MLTISFGNRPSNYENHSISLESVIKANPLPIYICSGDVQDSIT